jgi:hypothetical protein
MIVVARLMTTTALMAVLISLIGCKSTATKLTLQTTQWITENCMECGGNVLVQVPMPGIPCLGPT